MRFLFFSVFLFAFQLSALVAMADERVTVTMEEADTTLRVSVDGRPLLQYNKKPTEDAPRFAPHYSRSGYIHPLYSPAGKVLTGDYSPDHAHQHGLFFAWTKSKFRGKPTEFWNQAKKLGDVRFDQVLRHQDHPDRWELAVSQKFTSGKDSDEAILQEEWTIEVQKKNDSFFVFDLSSSQTCATEDPLVIEKHHYGGMALRGNPQWLAEDEKKSTPPGKMLTSEGLTRDEGNHSRPRWVCMYGPVDGEICGVAVMNHPDNFRHPQWVRLHPSKPYFVFAPMVEAGFEIKPDQPYLSRFRYVTFDGEPDVEALEELWKDFSEPQP